jgi:ATP-dependent helicase/nuclease subunit B
LTALINAFDRPDTPYLSQPRPAFAPRFSDYAHLARVKERAAGGGDGE